MKTLIKVFFLCIFSFIIKVSGQIDTLQYLKTNFEIQKSEYIGKTFSYLLDKMKQIQPKTVWSTVSYKGDMFASRFKFCEMDDSFYNAITFYIEWQEPISISQVRYYEKKNGFYFTNEEKNFYGNKIIKDIAVFR